MFGTVEESQANRCHVKPRSLGCIALKTSRKGGSKKKAGNIGKTGGKKNMSLKAKNTHYISTVRNLAAMIIIKQ